VERGSRALDAAAGSLVGRSSVAVSKLELRGITREYGATTAVRDIDLTVAAGEVVALLGPSGCGKTTLLMIVAGLVQPTRGEVLIDGVLMTRVAANRRRVGVVFQSYALFPHLTVRENILFGPQNEGLPRSEYGRVVDEVLQMVRLGGLGERYPSQLSGGQQQRVALGRALAMKPKLLLLDEPFSNLDAKVRESMRVELAHFLRQVGTTAIVVTHDQEDASHIADRVVVMSAGRTEQIGTYRDLYHRPASAFVADFLGHSNWMPGVLNSHADGGGRVTVNGELWTVAAPTAAAPGQAMRVMVRRGALRHCVVTGTQPRGEADTHNVLHGIVEKTVDLGSRTALWLRCNDVLAAFETSSPLAVRRGDKVILHLDPAACIAFPQP